MREEKSSKERRSTSIRKALITRLVLPPKEGEKSRFWPREMKIAKELMEKYPMEAFWEKFEIPYRVNSLAFFKMEKGSNLLKDKMLEFSFKPKQIQKSETLFDLKFGESLSISLKPQSLSQFLS
jgi:hypothetical protein